MIIIIWLSYHIIIQRLSLDQGHAFPPFLYHQTKGDQLTKTASFLKNLHFCPIMIIILSKIATTLLIMIVLTLFGFAMLRKLPTKEIAPSLSFTCHCSDCDSWFNTLSGFFHISVIVVIMMMIHTGEGQLYKGPRAWWYPTRKILKTSDHWDIWSEGYGIMMY